MKTQPILLISASVILFASLFFFTGCKNSGKPEKSEITQFLTGFNNRIKDGNTDSLLAYFDADKKVNVFYLATILSRKKGLDSKGKPIAVIALDVDNSDIKIDDGLVTAKIPIKLTHDSLASKQSALTLKIHKVSPHLYKIFQTDARAFLTDYLAYENFVRSKTIDEKAIYSPITLAAFKTAKQLKAKYDSIMWFAYIGNKTFFYVIKGKASESFCTQNGDNPADYKMGLVDPDLKEIVPVEYGLIHNIGGIFDGLVEVEKGAKKGFYNLDGKIVVPVKYDQIFPINDDKNLALLRDKDDYFYLSKDFSISDKIHDFKISDELSKIKGCNSSYTLSDKSSKILMEYNSRDLYTSLVVPPSYLVDLEILPKFINFQNPLRHPSTDEVGDGEGSVTYNVKFSGTEKKQSNWFESAYYSVMDEYLGARSGLYTSKHFVMADKKQNKLLSFSADSYFGGAESGGSLSGKCNDNHLRAINDTLFEFKTTSDFSDSGSGIQEGPYYHYLSVRNGQLVGLPGNRLFNCTKYVKMDDSYLKGCYVINDKAIDHLPMDLLPYIKNEIYASYGYKFKSPQWTETFEGKFDRYNGATNVNVEDSLTAIEKYNVKWINSKLNAAKPNTLAAK